jgi:hypothetical protein
MKPWLIALILSLGAVAELLVGFLVIAPRAQDDRTRAVMRVAFGISAASLFGLALAFALGWLAL